jgi:tRNA pseudouridine synthase 10
VPESSSPRPSQAPVKVFIEGRYRKLTRDLPQTLFYCPKCKGRGCEKCEGFGKLTRDSVQELVAWVAMPAFKARRNKFHGAGREDLNVRMLGNGRPFVLELLKSKRPQIDLEALAAEINRRNKGRLEVFDLRYSNKKRVVELKETRCCKDYRALVKVDPTPAIEASPAVEAKPAVEAVAAVKGQPAVEAVAAAKGQPAVEAVAAGPAIDPAKVDQILASLLERGRIDIVQSTPARVEHRRAMLDRERWIEVLEVSRADVEEHGENCWLITMRSQHGTYIKEAISGDGGRTKPSLSSFLQAACSCVELDVMAILPPEPEPEAEAVEPNSAKPAPEN